MENKPIEAWMFRKEGENFALFVGVIITVLISYFFYEINFWLFIFLIIAGLIYLKLLQAQQLGNSIRIHENQFPEIFEVFHQYATQLEIEKANLYIKQDPYLNAYTLGYGTCTVVLNSALVEQLTLKELSFVIGHELGHFKAGHTKINSLINPLGQGNLFSNFVFGFWGRIRIYLRPMRSYSYQRYRFGYFCNYKIITWRSVIQKIQHRRLYSSAQKIRVKISQIK